MQPRLVFQAVFYPRVQEKTKIKDCRASKCLIPRPGLTWRLTALWQPVRLHWSVCTVQLCDLAGWLEVQDQLSVFYWRLSEETLLCEAGSVSNELLVAKKKCKLNLMTYLICFLLENPHAYSPGKGFGYWEGNEQTWVWDQRHHKQTYYFFFFYIFNL